MKKLLIITICIFSITACAAPNDKKILAEFNESRLAVCPSKYIPNFFGKDHVKTVSQYKNEIIVTIAGTFSDGLNAIALFTYEDGEFLPVAIKVSEKHDYKGVNVPKILKDADIVSIMTVELGKSSPEALGFDTRESDLLLMEVIYVYMNYCSK